ncbi:MAG: T9SS type A sorting domain-containing protein [Flavobacteriales bacterium]|nr:T9SS type A sorting domain-containing protein [Flavobacteriales bacterium]
MKKLYLLSMGLAIASLSMAQRASDLPQLTKSQYKAYPKLRVAESMPSADMTPANTSKVGKIKPEVAQRVQFYEEVVGVTRYDLQSNSSVQNRLAQTGSQLSAGFTFSTQDVDWTDRGTGYNFSDGSDWLPEWPYQRAEETRVGWPSVMHTGSSKEVIITHDGVLDLVMISKDLGSTGSWTQVSIPNPTDRDLLWPRAVTGGPDGNSIHLICVTEPVANTGTEYEGLDGAILYWRSLDGGATWDQQAVLLPEIDGTQFTGFQGDTYAIFSRGDKVAFAEFNDLGDSFIMISDDNGTTWNKRILVDFPVDMYVLDTGIDLNEDAVADTIYNTDQSGALFIDSDEIVHAWWGDMFYTDDDLTDANFSYFPGTNGLSYWNEGLDDNAGLTITGIPDLDDSGVIELAADGANIPLYFVSMSGFPSAAQGEDGTLYVTFSGIVETHDNGDQNFRHVFIVKSEDNGETWSETPIDLTPDLDFDGYEYVFCSLAPVVDDKVHMIFQRDTEPGLHVRGDEDPADDNDIVYYCITTDLVVEPNVFEQFLENGITAYPNPANDQINIAIKGLTGGTVEVINAIGELVISKKVTNDFVTLDVNQLIPGIYTINVVGGESVRSTKIVVE